MRFVIFIDALDSKDVASCSGFIKDNYRNEYNPGVPKVTPNVISQVMTGNRQEDMPFIRSTPLNGKRETDIEGQTILHYAANRGHRVFQYGIPLCSNITLPDGSFSTFDHFMRNRPVPAPLVFMPERMNMLETDPEHVFHGMVDQTSILFSTMRTVARNDTHDIMFIGYTAIDAYTHCWNPENKARLLEVLEFELKDMNRYGEVLYFSDHGNTAMKEIFFVNQWLEANGWLKYKVNYELLEHHQPKDVKFPDSVNMMSPFVMVDWEHTKFYCADAFDSMIDATDKATDDDCLKLVCGLIKTGLFKNVDIREDVFSKNAICFDKTPRIMPDAAEGVVVSLNLHANAKDGGCMEHERKGWHSNRAVFGCTDPLVLQHVDSPRDVYDAMKQFVDLEEVKDHDDNEDKEIANQLANLGYM